MLSLPGKQALSPVCSLIVPGIFPLALLGYEMYLSQERLRLSPSFFDPFEGTETSVFCTLPRRIVAQYPMPVNSDKHSSTISLLL